MRQRVGNNTVTILRATTRPKNSSPSLMSTRVVTTASPTSATSVASRKCRGFGGMSISRYRASCSKVACSARTPLSSVSSPLAASSCRARSITQAPAVSNEPTAEMSTSVRWPPPSAAAAGMAAAARSSSEPAPRIQSPDRRRTSPLAEASACRAGFALIRGRRAVPRSARGISTRPSLRQVCKRRRVQCRAGRRHSRTRRRERKQNRHESATAHPNPISAEISSESFCSRQG